MDQDSEIEMQLWDYIDGTCSDAERQRVEQLITSDVSWRLKFDELSAVHAGISGNMDVNEPSMRFTQNVMDLVGKEHIAPATKQYINKSVIGGIAALFIVMLTAILGYAFATAHYTSGSGSLLSGLNLSKANFNQYFNSTTVNMIIAVNIVLGLVLTDKVLRRKNIAAK